MERKETSAIIHEKQGEQAHGTRCALIANIHLAERLSGQENTDSHSLTGSAFYDQASSSNGKKCAVRE